MKLKKLAVVLFAVPVMAFSSGDVTNAVQSIDPTVTTNRVHLEKINYPTDMYTADGTDALIQRLEALIEDGKCSCVERDERRIAMFIIPINFDADDITYSDFELKATTNNYSHLYDEYTRLQYYSQSEKADTGITLAEAESLGLGENGALDKMWIFVCTSKYPPDADDGFEGDSRSYYWIGNTLMSKWNNPIIEVVVLVDTSCLNRHPESEGEDGKWLGEENEELIWSYTRYYGNGTTNNREHEPGTTYVYWHPIAPVRWYRKMPEWAERQIKNAGNL